MALPLRALLAFSLVGGVCAGGLAVQGGDDSVAKSLERMLKQTVDDTVEQLTLSPMRSAGLAGVVEGGRIVELQITVKPRGGAAADLASTLVNLQTRQGSHHAAMGSPDGPYAFAVTDQDKSLPEVLNAQDLAEIKIPLASLGGELGPRTVVDLLLRTPEAKPLHLHFETPATMTGRYVMIHAYEVV